MKAVYPGSFDPITFGHVDIITRIQPLFDEVIVLVASSGEKSYLFDPEQRVELIKKTIPNLDNIRVVANDGLTVDYARAQGAGVIVRGIRMVADFEYEMAMANVNKKLEENIETLVIFANPKYNYVSSRMVKEVANYGGDLKELVPGPVVEELTKKFTKK